ncbi:MAG: glycosyltransferase family 2 protein [Pseudomonadales bacterium]
MNQTPFFSIVIATRDRPKMFLAALDSVANQDFAAKELIVVVDGSSDENMTKYKAIEKQRGDVTFHYLTHRKDGHGQSYSVNYGASKSNGEFLCFLDDDDEWTDFSYLQNLYNSIEASSKPVDVHYSHQKALFADGKPQNETVWLEDRIPLAQSLPEIAPGTHQVDRTFLLKSAGFGHLNCSAFSRKFFDSINGMDESIRYENDRDLFIRSIDVAEVILFSTRYMSLHHIPDNSKKDNMSTMASNIEKKLYQMRVYDKGVALGKSQEIASYCRRGKTYEQKHLARILEKNGDIRGASQYAREALLSGFTLKWLAYTIQISARSLFHTRSDTQSHA